MKKQIISILTVIICFSVFSGCANDEGVLKNNTKQVATTSEVTTIATTTTTSTTLTTTSNKTTRSTTRKSSKIKDTKPITTSSTTTTKPVTTQSTTTTQHTTTQPTTTQKSSDFMQPITQPSTTQQTKLQNQTNKNEPCKHDSTGNIGGWYKTATEAREAIRAYIINSGKEGYAHWKYVECSKCGLWSGYVTFDK